MAIQEKKTALLSKLDLKNTEVAAKNAASDAVTDLTGGLPSLDGIEGLSPEGLGGSALDALGGAAGGALDQAQNLAGGAAAGKLQSIGKDALGGAAGGALDQLSSGASGALSKATSGLTSKVPKGLKQVGQNLLDQVNPKNVFDSSVEELKSIKDLYKDVRNRVNNVKSAAGGGANLGPGESADAIIRDPFNARGKVNTFIFPEDNSPELCFRLDFVKFSRQSVFTNEKADIVSTFILPLPRTIGFEQGTSYNQEELGAVGDLESRIRTGGGDASLSGFAAQAGGGLATSVYRTALQTDIGKAASQSLGFIPNPHLSNIFAGVPLRSFSFDIQLTPRSQKESEVLNAVLDEVRKYTLPALSDNFTTMDYPHEVLISFSQAGSSLVQGSQTRTYKTPLDKIFKFKRCVVTSMNVSINSQEQAFFSDYSPVETIITLGFQEQQIQVANQYGRDPISATGSQDLLKSAGSLLSSDSATNTNTSQEGQQ